LQKDNAPGCVMVLAKSGWLELGDTTLWTLYVYLHFNHCDIIGLKICWIRWKKAK